MTVDMINHPPHYTQGKYETIDIIEDTNWGYRLATAFKYLHRCDYKGKKKEDLRKAVWFILREIDSLPDAPTEPAAEDYGYHLTKFECKSCQFHTDVIDSNGRCSDCRNHLDAVDEPTKTSVGDTDNPYEYLRRSESPSKPLDPPVKVILHNDPKNRLEAHTEAHEYRDQYRKSFGTHKPNSDQLVIQGLAAYD